ncbi:MAG: 50S ribosomal protein L10, partial [Candidatus Methanomethylicaceae archaeon]
MARASLEVKKSIVEKLVTLFQNYSIFAIGNLHGMKAKHIQSIRKNFRGLFEVYVAKNTLIKKALEKIPKFNEHIEEISKYLTGQNILIFSNTNPFSLYLLLEKNKIPSEASPGDIATEDIIVPAGNTGLQPGPILSKFSAAKIPTKIQEGSVWIVKDTIVAKKGDVISADLADILKKLGLKPIMVGLKLKMAFDGTVIPGEVLAIDLEFVCASSPALLPTLFFPLHGAHVAWEVVVMDTRTGRAYPLRVGFSVPRRGVDLQTGASAAAGSAVGLLLGGALTSYLSWRWTLYV